jgi:hypothetical protein
MRDQRDSDPAERHARATYRRCARHPPDGYGIEWHLNIEFAMQGRTTVAIHLGEYVGPLRGYRNTVPVADAVAATILDRAVAHGRIAPDARGAWDAWTARVIAALATVPPSGRDGDEFLARVADAANQPLPNEPAVL